MHEQRAFSSPGLSPNVSETRYGAWPEPFASQNSFSSCLAILQCAAVGDLRAFGQLARIRDEGAEFGERYLGASGMIVPIS